jgi:hypothetical protein
VHEKHSDAIQKTAAKFLVKSLVLSSCLLRKDQQSIKNIVIFENDLSLWYFFYVITSAVSARFITLLFWFFTGTIPKKIAHYYCRNSNNCCAAMWSCSANKVV